MAAHASGLYYDASCPLIARSRRGRGWPRWSSWLLANGTDLARRVPLINATHFMSLLAGTQLHVVGDSLADNLRYSLAALLACTREHHAFQLLSDLGGAGGDEDEVAGLIFPHFHLRLQRLVTHFFMREREVAQSIAAGSWYVDTTGQRRPMNTQANRIVVLLNDSLGEWADASRYAAAPWADRSCKLVIIVAGQWFHPRSDVDLYDHRGAILPRNAFLGDVYSLALRRAAEGLSATLGRNALVAWLSYSPQHALSDERCVHRAAGRTADGCAAQPPAGEANAILANVIGGEHERLRRRQRAAVNGSHGGPRHVLVNITEESACWADGHVGCIEGRRSADGLHWALPGVPDLWASRVYEALREHSQRVGCGSGHR